MDSLPSDAPAPRLCHLIKWPHFDGYGFNLHAEKSKSGQFVGKVDVGSPAESAGLREGDRIIEVNGVNIANENHRQVVERIKAVPNETKLLVLDIAGDEWYKEKGIVVKVTQENVIFMKTPVAEEPQKEHIPESSHNGKGIDQITEEQQQRLHGKEQETTSTVTTTTRREETPVVSANSGANVVSANSGANCSRKTPHDQAEHASHGEENDTHKQQHQEGLVDGVRALSCAKEENRDGGSSPESSSVPSSSPTVKHILNNNNIDAVKNHNSEQKSNCSVKETPNTNGVTVVNGGSDVTDSPVVPPSPTSLKSASSGASNGGHSSLDGSSLEMNLNMSVSQMRQMLAQKKKPDPKKVQMDLKQKYEIISSM